MLRERLPYAAVPVVALFIALNAVDLPYYSEGPGPAREVTPLISVHDHQVFASSGRFILTAVSTTPLNLFRYVAAKLDPAQEVVPESFFIAPEQTRGQANQVAVYQMDQSQVDATLLVLSKLAGYPRHHGAGVLIENVGPDCPATGHLAPGQVITEVDGEPVDTIARFERAVSAVPPARPVSLTVQAADQSFTARLTRRPCGGSSDPIFGIAPVPNFPFPVRISLADVGGPSAGLMWALGLYDLLTPGDLSAGHTVAGTGTIDPAGHVGPIGGVENKVAAARKAGADVFLVPAGENFTDAKAVAGDLPLVPVTTFAQALDYLLHHGGSATTPGPGPTPSASAPTAVPTGAATPSPTPS
jgi:Lon-like protease